jgi:tungstate transport system ATP-binding protein
MIEHIEASGIRKSYNGRTVLDCSLGLEKGVLYSVLGPNGSGKSTLLRLLGLLERPDSGSVTYSGDGADLLNPYDDIKTRRKAVLVTARAALFNDSVYDNVAFGLRKRGCPGRETRERVLEALNAVKLYEKRSEKALNLSSGEGQRLAIARALVIKPDVLFLDEPTASHDPQNTRHIEGIISAWKEESAGIIVVVTHNMFQARRLSDVVVMLYEGGIAEVSPTGSFFECPSSEVGRMFVSGEIY